MRGGDRQARLKRAKELGRLGFDALRFEDICGVIELEGEEKHLREFEHRELTGSLLTPFRAAARPDEFSRIRFVTSAARCSK